jgi:hypothetical protein
VEIASPAQIPISYLELIVLHLALELDITRIQYQTHVMIALQTANNAIQLLIAQLVPLLI